LKWFIKKTPHQARPSKIIGELYQDGAEYAASDHTSYEASFRRVMFDSCEFIVYDYLTQNLPQHEDFMWYLKNVIGNWNFVHFKDFKFSVYCTRMSGEMNTSSGNGIYNLITTMYLYYTKYGEEAFNLKIYVEGDDGIHRVIGSGLTQDDYKKVGLITKLERSYSITELSFCGIIMDDKDMINVTSPISYTVDFFWLNRQYFNAKTNKLRSLLKCKALSTLCQYPGCPIIYPLAKKVLSLLPDITIDEDFILRAPLDNYKKDIMILNLRHFVKHPHLYNIDIPIRTRRLVEKLFKIDVAIQLEIESYIQSAKCFPIIFPDCIYNYMNKDWLDFYDRFTYDIQLPIGQSVHPYVTFRTNNFSDMLAQGRKIAKIYKPNADFNKLRNFILGSL